SLLSACGTGLPLLVPSRSAVPLENAWSGRGLVALGEHRGRRGVRRSAETWCGSGRAAAPGQVVRMQDSFLNAQYGCHTRFRSSEVTRPVVPVTREEPMLEHAPQDSPVDRVPTVRHPFRVEFEA